MISDAWQCWNWGHASNVCHLGKVCFLCRCPGHKKAECHIRKKLPISISMGIAGGKRKAHKSVEFRWNKQHHLKASSKICNMGVLFERGNGVSMGGIGKEVGHTRPLEVETVETVCGSGTTNLGVECNKTYEVEEDGSDQELKSNIVGKVLANIENDSPWEKAITVEIGTTSYGASVFVADNKDSEILSPCNGVCGGAGIEMLTRELEETTMQIVDARNMAKVENEENLDFTDMQTIWNNGGRQRGRNPLGQMFPDKERITLSVVPP